MPVAGIYTNQGRKYKSELFKLSNTNLSPDEVQGVFWCAIGLGDNTFQDPENPPAPESDQIGCKVEKIRKKTSDLKWIFQDANGLIIFGGVRYSESLTATALMLVSWEFDFNEANFTWKELSFHGGDVTLSVPGDVGVNGIYNASTNPDGEVTSNGRGVYILNIPSRDKDPTVKRPVRLLITF